MTGVYAYAVVPAATRLDPVTGVGGRAVTLVAADRLALVTSDVPESLATLADPDAPPGALADLARQHDAVVRSALADAGAVLPFRLGTVLTGEDAARRVLAERADELSEGLARVSGCREWGVQVRDVGAAGSEAIPAGVDAPPAGVDAESGAPGAGTAYLRRRADALAEERRRRAERCRVAGRVDDALRVLAIDAVEGGHREADLLLDESYLVPVEVEERFLAAVDAHGDRLAGEGYALRATGPWPPYSFAALDVRSDGP
jgi:hypothetical protein